MPDLEVTVGRVLASRRRRANLTQEAVAEACGLHATYVSQLERGLKSPTLRVLFRLADAVGISPSAFVRAVERDLSRHRESSSGGRKPAR